jgi:hypothetical protein
MRRRSTAKHRGGKRVLDAKARPVDGHDFARIALGRGGGVQARCAYSFWQGGFDFRREDIALAGEAPTGRLQLRAEVGIGTAGAGLPTEGITLARGSIDDSTGATGDGTSNTILYGERIYYGEKCRLPAR